MNGEWVKKLLESILKAYFAESKKSGKTMTNPPASISSAQYIDICDTLHRSGVRGIENCCLLSLDFILLGRIGEIGDLRWNHLTYSDKFKVLLLSHLSSVFSCD
jgi:hypothetical protein